VKEREEGKRERRKIQITSMRAKRLNEFLFEHKVHLFWRAASGQKLVSPSSQSVPVLFGPLRLPRPLLRV
jgi:hypothetical protein